MAEQGITALTPLQADGLACVVCGADYFRIRDPHVPVGRSVTGSQVFACVSCHLPDAQRAGGALQ
jgi:mono/diheme cytochrome c family protein